jgi:hypothetical protein
MGSTEAEWNVLGHGPIETLAENLWWVSGDLPGMSLKRNMTVVRLPDGQLLIHNGIALNPEGMERLERWGTPSVLLVPNGMHRLDAPAYKRRYPALRVLAPVGSRKKVEQRVAVDGTYDDLPANDTVTLQTLAGTKRLEGAMVVRSADGVTVVFNDIVFNMDKKTDFLGWAFTTVMGSAPGPRMSRLAKLLLVGDKAVLRGELQGLADLPGLTRLIVAHEKVAHGADARAALVSALGYL